jgi:ABC-type sugar transport system substrate-binding protein
VFLLLLTSTFPMKRLLAATLFLVLAGCASSSRFDEDRPTTMVVPPTTGQVVPQNLSPAARAAAPETGAPAGDLMECVTESCKINCSPKVKKQFQPKWCVYFKEPV